MSQFLMLLTLKYCRKTNIAKVQQKCQRNTCTHLSFSYNDKYLSQTHLPRKKVNNNLKNTVNVARQQNYFTSFAGQETQKKNK